MELDFSQTLTIHYMAPLIFTLKQSSRHVPFAEKKKKTAPKHDACTPCFTVGIEFFPVQTW